MNQQQLSSMWTFWSTYSSSSRDKGPQSQEDYLKNLVRILSFHTLEELAYVLGESKLGSLDNFFSNIESKKVIK